MSRIDSEAKIRRGGSIEPNESFSYKMRNGINFRIDHICLLQSRTLAKQLRERQCVQVKFCVRDDEEFPGSETTEQWEIVFFPMFDKNDNEVVHGTVLDYADSAINGNLFVFNRKIVSSSSNHYSNGYLMLQDPVVEYASKCFEDILENL
jgi:hypothetical protein